MSVLVLLASGDPGDGSTHAIEQALQSALVRDASVTVRPSPNAANATSDEEAAALAAATHAGLVCVVSWSHHQRHVVVRFAELPADHWKSRELNFERADAANERGRTVGFALASMMPDEVFADAAKKANTEAAAETASEPWPDLDAPDAPEHPKTEHLPKPSSLTLEALALAATTPDGYGGGVGGAVGLRIPLASALSLHLEFNARAGDAGPGGADLHIVGGQAGLAWQPWLDARHRWAAGGRIDALAQYVSVDPGRTDGDSDDGTVNHVSKFLGGTVAVAEGTYRFSERAALVSAIGTEIVFDRTDLFVRDGRQASISPARLVAELGLRISFP